MDEILQVKGLRTSFLTSTGEVQSVRGVSFSLGKGEALGIVGESGSGKSVTSLSILRLLASTGRIKEGEVLFEGKDLTKIPQKQLWDIRGGKIAMIFQDPMSSLNPLARVGKQVEEMIATHEPNLSKQERQARALELFRLVRIPEPEKRYRSYPHEFSGGMRQRVMIAMALACKPDILIADEPTTALDVTIQAQILRLISQLKDKMGTSVILITHDLGVVAEIADKVMVMYAGEAVEYADVHTLYRQPMHPYTEGLLKSVPVLGRKVDTLYSIPGTVPSPRDYPKGCRFAPRCAYCEARCLEEHPPLYDLPGGGRARCFRCEGGHTNG